MRIELWEIILNHLGKESMLDLFLSSKVAVKWIFMLLLIPEYFMFSFSRVYHKNRSHQKRTNCNIDVEKKIHHLLQINIFLLIPSRINTRSPQRVKLCFWKRTLLIPFEKDSWYLANKFSTVLFRLLVTVSFLGRMTHKLKLL